MTTATQFERQETEVIEDRAPKSGAQLLLESIAAQGVDTIFGYPGGAIMPVYDVLPKLPQLRHILCRHEQGCGMAAIGYARATPRRDQPRHGHRRCLSGQRSCGVRHGSGDI